MENLMNTNRTVTHRLAVYQRNQDNLVLTFQLTPEQTALLECLMTHRLTDPVKGFPYPLDYDFEFFVEPTAVIDQGCDNDTLQLAI